MKIFAVADLHLSFNENIDKPMNKFGPGWEDHPDRLKASWERLVTDDDIVLVPGDISWALRIDEALADFDWIHALPGKKLVSKGNHDLWWSRIQYLNSLYDDIIFLRYNHMTRVCILFLCSALLCPSRKPACHADARIRTSIHRILQEAL